MKNNALSIVMFIFSFLTTYQKTFGQSIAKIKTSDKPALQVSDLGKWPILSEPLISNDGKYFCYIINDRLKESLQLIVKKLNGAWMKTYNVDDAYTFLSFSGDNKMLVFKNRDSLFFISLGSNVQRSIAHIESVKSPQTSHGKWMAYRLAASNRVEIFDLQSGFKKSFSEVDDYRFESNGKSLLLISDATNTIQLFDLESKELVTLFSSALDKPVEFNFDLTGTQLAFSTQRQGSDLVETSIWYYKPGFPRAKLIAHDSSKNISGEMQISGSPEFSKNGRWLFFTVQRRDEKLPPADKSMVDVWNYKDLIINPEQRRLLSKGPHACHAVINLSDFSILCYEKENENTETYSNDVTGDFIVLRDYSSNWEYYWKWCPQPSFYLVSLKDGSRTLIKSESRSVYNPNFSPSGKYLLYFDNIDGHYYSMDVTSKQIKNITTIVPSTFVKEYSNSIEKVPVGDNAIAAWGKNDSSVLIYDNYDIWRIDLAGEVKPVNMTNGYGARNQIKFRIVNESAELPIFDHTPSFLMTAFNVDNKYNGFYKFNLPGQDPKLLTMGPYTYYCVSSQKPHFYGFSEGMKPVKAKDRNIWIIKRQSDREAPNYFTTSDFIKYKRETDLQPQRNVNWLRTELITWKMFNGQMSKGVLYKPENFDPRKKYPLILHYYEKLSQVLYEFPYPDLFQGNIDFAYLVSNGYLVFLPDIEYKIASKTDTTYGGWAYNSVVSAAENLSRLPYVDRNRMAIQGHSFGGGETNYIVSHTNLFAAAAEAAGITDPLSAYLSLVPFVSQIEHVNPQPLIENGHSLTGATPWEKPDMYLKSSPVLNADKMTTPLLIMHNEKDNQIPYRQGVEFFMALRRLGKPVWLLQYDNGNHGVYEKDAVDYTIRMTQFFDHYLKGVPAPVWMTQGVSAKYKGIKTGYELDTSNKCSVTCPICNPTKE